MIKFSIHDFYRSNSHLKKKEYFRPVLSMTSNAAVFVHWSTKNKNVMLLILGPASPEFILTYIDNINHI